MKNKLGTKRLKIDYLGIDVEVLEDYPQGDWEKAAEWADKHPAEADELNRVFRRAFRAYERKQRNEDGKAQRQSPKTKA
jgi:hypothetical protein